MTETTIPTYESVQQEAKGPGVDEWRRADKLRSSLTELYRELSEDDRYAPEYKSETAWAKYEETKAQVEKLAPEARTKMLRSADSLERMSIPTPEGEGIYTKDVSKLMLTASERGRIEGLINRSEKAAGGSGFKVRLQDLLKGEYARGLEEGGPGGGATVRAVYELARDWGVDFHAIVDEHRKAHHHEALEKAEAARYRANLIGRAVPEPPFKKGATSLTGGARGPGRSNSPRAFVPRENRQMLPKKSRHW